MGDAEQRHRIVLLGAGKVGKSAIAMRILFGTFPEQYKETVEDLHPREYDIHGTILKVDILDTAGDLVFPAMRRLSIDTAHAFVLVYSIDNPCSFNEIKQIWEQIKEQRSGFRDIPIVVVGNKCDSECYRQVDRCDVQDWVESEGLGSNFLEVSAKENSGIWNIFEKLLDQANIPEVRKVEPILKRRLSEKSGPVQNRLKVQDETRHTRSRSLIRRNTKPKVKHTGDPNRNDCPIS